MKVSVIIPNYNHATFLRQRIDSVLNQTYQDFEVIILDDCSTDSGVDIINTYKNHPKVTDIVINTKNSGSTFKQWEKGVALAKGEYIWIAESDDYSDVTFLECAMQKLAADKTLGLYFCNYHSINEDGSIIPSNHTYTSVFINSFKDNKCMNGKDFCEQYLFFSSMILNASGVVFKKAFFESSDKSYAQLKVSGDWRMWANLCYNTFIFFDEKRLNYFRMHPNNVRSAKAKLMGAEAVQNMIYFINKTNDKTIRQKLKEAICKTWVYSFYLNKNFGLNIMLVKGILQVDGFFPVRLLKRITSKLLHKSKLVHTHATQ